MKRRIANLVLDMDVGISTPRAEALILDSLAPEYKMDTSALKYMHELRARKKEALQKKECRACVSAMMALEKFDICAECGVPKVFFGEKKDGTFGVIKKGCDARCRGRGDSFKPDKKVVDAIKKIVIMTDPREIDESLFQAFPSAPYYEALWKNMKEAKWRAIHDPASQCIACEKVLEGIV